MKIEANSYEAERRPFAQRVVERAQFSIFNQIAIATGTGVVNGAEPEWNRSQLDALLADTNDGFVRRRVLFEYFNTNRVTSEHIGLEMNCDYADAGVVSPDGSEREVADPLGVTYTQSSRPGQRMPHAWLATRDGARVATHTLLIPGAFLLLAGDRPDAWMAAATAVRNELGVSIVVHAIGRDQALIDDDRAWTALRAHDDDGALVVRPDGFVVMRKSTGSTDTEAELESALRTALGYSTMPSANPSYPLAHTV